MEVQFDPGFVQHMSAFVPNIEYMYSSLSQYKNFNQKKMQFKMYYPKVLNLIKNYMGFYIGCILWAVIIKQEDNAEIMNNLCYGGEYSEKETLSEINFMREYFEQLKKDAKYYMGQNFEVDEDYIKILDVYGEFLKLNEGFVHTSTTNDLKLPENCKNFSKEDIETFKKEIDKVVESGKLAELLKVTKALRY